MIYNKAIRKFAYQQNNSEQHCCHFHSCSCSLSYFVYIKCVQPTDSLTRPSELIPPGSPIRFIDICNVARRITSQEEEGEEEAGCEGNQTGEGTSYM